MNPVSVLQQNTIGYACGGGGSKVTMAPLPCKPTNCRQIGVGKKRQPFLWYWNRTRDQASHDPIPIPLGYRGHKTHTKGLYEIPLRFKISNPYVNKVPKDHKRKLFLKSKTPPADI
ncbi:hypothetical protein TNCV_1144011 [Trichonephila clavipes]|nr:hypothetical protein TNCV_1144011 [Trichonephila clavipes]